MMLRVPVMLFAVHGVQEHLMWPLTRSLGECTSLWPVRCMTGPNSMAAAAQEHGMWPLTSRMHMQGQQG